MSDDGVRRISPLERVPVVETTRDRDGKQGKGRKRKKKRDAPIPADPPADDEEEPPAKGSQLDVKA